LRREGERPRARAYNDDDHGRSDHRTVWEVETSAQTWRMVAGRKVFFF
jgi:hypothetical protein